MSLNIMIESLIQSLGIDPQQLVKEGMDAINEVTKTMKSIESRLVKIEEKLNINLNNIQQIEDIDLNLTLDDKKEFEKTINTDTQITDTLIDDKPDEHELVLRNLLVGLNTMKGG